MGTTELVQLIEQRCRELNIPESRLSRAVAGHSSLVSDMRRGRSPSTDRLEQVCQELGLEFYVGPSRGELELSVTKTVKIRGSNIERNTRLLVDSILEAGGNPFPPDLQDDAVMPLVAANANAAPPGARPVDVVEFAAAAGGGADAASEEVCGLLWFSRGWLDRNDLDSTQCAVIRVRGKSMEPTLPDGCSIMIDRSRRTLRDREIFVVRTSAGLIVKRAARLGREWLLVSDNPEIGFEKWPPGAETIGEVVWMAQSVKQPEMPYDPKPGSQWWDSFDPKTFSTSVRILGRMRRDSFATPAAIVNLDVAAETRSPSNDERPSGQAWFDRAWLRYYGLHRDNCALTLVRDDLMEPEFPAGSAVLFDRGLIDPEEGGVYVVRMPDGRLAIRRARPTGTSWELAADKQEAAEAIPWPSLPDLVGGVVWSGRTHIKSPWQERLGPSS